MAVAVVVWDRLPVVEEMEVVDLPSPQHHRVESMGLERRPEMGSTNGRAPKWRAGWVEGMGWRKVVPRGTGTPDMCPLWELEFVGERLGGW